MSDQLELEKVREFLISRNWTPEKARFPNVEWLVPPVELGLSNDFAIRLPLTLEFPDVQRHLKIQIQVLSDLYSLPLQDIEYICSTSKTLWKIRSFDAEFANGSMGLSSFTDALVHLKTFLLNAAGFTINPVPSIDKFSDYSRYYLNNCRISAPVKGSFVTQVELPNNEVIKPESLLEPEIRGTHVNKYLEKIFAFTYDKLPMHSSTPYREWIAQYKDIVNLQVLEEMHSFMSALNSNSVSLSFLNTYQSCQFTTESLITEVLPSIESLTKTLEDDLINEIPIEGQGTVIKLQSQDVKNNSNTIIAQVFTGQKTEKIKVQLTSSQYQKAIEAHKNGKNIYIKGIALKGKQQHVIINLEDIKL